MPLDSHLVNTLGSQRHYAHENSEVLRNSLKLTFSLEIPDFPFSSTNVNHRPLLGMNQHFVG